jgi:hypothetical protein
MSDDIEVDEAHFDLKWVDDRDGANSSDSVMSSEDDYDGLAATAAPEESVAEAKTRPIADAEKLLMPLQTFLEETDPTGHVAACNALLKEVRPFSTFFVVSFLTAL